MKIRVTQQHIEEGRRGSCRECPIALAIVSAGFFKAWVGASQIRANGKLWCDTPPEVYRFIQKFDTNKRVKPFEFEIPDAA